MRNLLLLLGTLVVLKPVPALAQASPNPPLGLPTPPSSVQPEHQEPASQATPPPKDQLTSPANPPANAPASPPAKTPASPPANAPPNTKPENQEPASQITPPQDSPPANAPASQDEFEKIFGRPRIAGVQRVIVPLFINDQSQGQILVLLSASGAVPVRVQGVPFLRQTESSVSPEIQATLKAAIDPEGFLSLEAVRQTGVEAIFDDRRLELRIQVPPPLRKTNLFNLRDSQLPREAANALRPANLSGYLNVRASERLVWLSDSASRTTGRQPFALDLEGAINFKGWVLEGSANFLENGNPTWLRNDFRLVRDDPANALRYVAGDLSIPIVGYQSSRPQVGLMVARNFSLQPYRVTRPISQYEFFLERPSRVEIYTNGVLVQTLFLPAGPQDVRNFAVNAGINNVQLVITDDVGRIQRLDFSTATAAGLLEPGLQQFAYSVGFPTKFENGDRSYAWSQPTLTLSHVWGVSKVLTLGAYTQANFDVQLVGVVGTWATSIGNIGWDVAFSHANNAGSDLAFRLRYDFIKTSSVNPYLPTFGVLLEHRGANFTTLDDLDLYQNEAFPNNGFNWDLTAYYNQRLFWDINSNLSFRYQIGRDQPDTYQISWRLSKSFRNGLGVSLLLSQNHTQQGTDEQRAALSLFWVFPRARQSVQSTTEISNVSEPTQRLNWSYSSLNPYNGINLALETALTSTDFGINGRFTYNGHRVKIDLFQDNLIPRDRDGGTFSATRLDIGTAIVFADGQWGISRPINGSFAIVAPNANLRGQFIGVNPNGTGGFVAQTDWLGAAVVPSLQPYQLSNLRIAVPNLPLGYELGPTTYSLLPSYKSGTLVRAGTDATVFVRGVLAGPGGEPISLQAGEIVSLSDSSWKPLPIFTNKVGRFVVTGFKPGRYELHLYADPKAIVPFEIPAGKTGVYDVGTLKLPVPIKTD